MSERHNGSDEISLIDLYANQKVMISRQDSVEKTTASNHTENQKVQNKLSEDILKVANEVWKLKIKIAGYSAVGGAIAAIIGHLIDKALK